MTQIGDVERIAKSRKAKRCDWCSELIEVGAPACRWLWKDGSEVIAVRVHPECFDGGVTELEHGDEWDVGEHARGCLCERGHCECARQEPARGAEGTDG